MKEIYRLSEFERGDFYFLSNKIVLNQTIHQKDFSEFSIRQVNFSNCIFDWTSFPCTKCEDLTFEGCILQNASFKKSELENFIWENIREIEVLEPIYLREAIKFDLIKLVSLLNI